MNFNELQEERILIEKEMYNLIDDLFEERITLEEADHYALNTLMHYYRVIRDLKEIGGWY